MLKLKPATQLIGGKQTPCYGVFFGDHEIEKVPALRYDDARKYVYAANVALSATGRKYNAKMATTVYFQSKQIFSKGKRNKLAREALGVIHAI
jgi:hypothetical protein